MAVPRSLVYRHSKCKPTPPATQKGAGKQAWGMPGPQSWCRSSDAPCRHRVLSCWHHCSLSTRPPPMRAGRVARTTCGVDRPPRKSLVTSSVGAPLLAARWGTVPRAYWKTRGKPQGMIRWCGRSARTRRAAMRNCPARVLARECAFLDAPHLPLAHPVAGYLPRIPLCGMLANGQRSKAGGLGCPSPARATGQDVSGPIHQSTVTSGACPPVGTPVNPA